MKTLFLCLLSLIIGFSSNYLFNKDKQSENTGLDFTGAKYIHLQKDAWIGNTFSVGDSVTLYKVGEYLTLSPTLCNPCPNTLLLKIN